MNKYKTKYNYTVVSIETDYLTSFSNGKKKTVHFFEKVFECNSLDAVVCGILALHDGFYRVIRRANKKFLPTLNVRKVGNIVYF